MFPVNCQLIQSPPLQSSNSFSLFFPGFLPWLTVITTDSTAKRKMINKTFTSEKCPHLTRAHKTYAVGGWRDGENHKASWKWIRLMPVRELRICKKVFTLKEKFQHNTVIWTINLPWEKVGCSQFGFMFQTKLKAETWMYYKVVVDGEKLRQVSEALERKTPSLMTDINQTNLITADLCLLATRFGFIHFALFCFCQ